jgi:hypothetical protein
MGLLDEAIREHLELKRRHGADPTEVARQEQEALGPARRAAEPEPEPYEVEPEQPAPEAEPEPFAPEPEPEPPAEARRIDPDLVDQPTVEHPAAKPEPLAEDESTEDFVVRRDASKGDASQVDPEVGDEGDVLEATPEFLEETPEHDRLWFEQRPPRDFDFDD